ncbi:four helix bundle protein [candidate division TA06 bacterium]|nr:four helix bundle protein [candidate division TA06 bacterium]
MGTFRKFEDITAWQKARELTKLVYEITKDGSFSKDFGLRDQIRRAAISMMSNIAEGFDRGGRKEFIQFLSIAKGSTGEVKSQLYIAVDQNYITKDLFDKTFSLAEEVNRLIFSLIKYLSNTEIKGIKYKVN